MDSSNSGSMQSSSGGDEEYDSRADSISAFLSNPPPSHVGPFSTNPHPQHNQNTHMFDPLSNYLDPPIQRSPSSLSNPNSLLSLDMVWSKHPRSEPNPADLGGLIPSSSSPQNQAFFSSQFGGQPRGAAFSPTRHPLPPEGAPPAPGLLSVSASNDPAQAHNTTTNTNVVRNPKKRSRASRRAPTTVLTTDTTNFRAMVQEFTGIPAPPFISSPFPRSRLDLFATAAPSPMRSSHFNPAPPTFLLRPFAHKVQPPLSFGYTSSSSSIPSSFPTSSMVDTLPNSNATNSTATNSTPVNYQLSSDLGLPKQQPPPQNNLINVNMHNPILNFQSILQAPSKYPLGNSALLASKTQGSFEIPPTADSLLKMGVVEEFRLNHASVNANTSGLQNMVSSSSDGALLSRGNVSNPSSDWGCGRTGTNNDGDHGVLRSLSGNYNSIVRAPNGKINYSASSSDFHGEKGLECVAGGRSEGMIESWINCSSD